MSKPIKFKKFERFDAVRAEKGVEHEVRDESGNFYGIFTTSLWDINSRIMRVALETYEREYGDRPEAKGDKAGIFEFVMANVHGWREVLDEDDKEVPFSKEAAFQLLSANDEDTFLFNALRKMSSETARYKKVGDPRASKDDVAGN